VNRFAVFLAVDKNMFAPAVFAAHSALLRTPKNPFDVIIAVPQNTLPRSWIAWAERKLGTVVTEFPFEKHLVLPKSTDARLPATAYRYLHDRFLAPRYERLVFLDPDIRVDGDLSALFDLDLEGRAFAAVPDLIVSADATGQFREYLANLGIASSMNYANAGVLLIDRLLWATENLSELTLGYLRDHADICWTADQDALNAVVQGRFQKLSPVWNMMSEAWFRSDLKDVVRPTVFHYSGPAKPWRPLTWRHDPGVTGLYREFFRRSPWVGEAKRSGTFAEWRSYLKFRRRAILRRLRGRPPVHSLPPANQLKILQHVRESAFADVEQGLAVRENGILHAAGL